MTVQELKESVCYFGALAYEKNLVVGTGGNISFRHGDHIYISPHARELSDLKPEELIKVDMNGNYEGDVEPSVETGLHLRCYKECPDAQAVIHLHSFYSTLVGITADESIMPAYTGAYKYKVGNLGIVPYYPSGDERLMDAVGSIINKKNAVLLKNHGIVVCAPSLRKAFNLCEDVETNAHMHMIMKGTGALD